MFITQKPISFHSQIEDFLVVVNISQYIIFHFNKQKEIIYPYSFILYGINQKVKMYVYSKNHGKLY